MIATENLESRLNQKDYEMKYQIVRASDMYELIDRVNAYIEHGWKPQGGVNSMYVPITGIFEWTQAIIKDRDEKSHDSSTFVDR